MPDWGARSRGGQRNGAGSGGCDAVTEQFKTLSRTFPHAELTESSCCCSKRRSRFTRVAARVLACPERRRSGAPAGRGSAGSTCCAPARTNWGHGFPAGAFRERAETEGQRSPPRGPEKAAENLWAPLGLRSCKQSSRLFPTLPVQVANWEGKTSTSTRWALAARVPCSRGGMV